MKRHEREGSEFTQATKQGVTIALGHSMPHMKKPWQQWKPGRPFRFTSTTGWFYAHREPGMVGATFGGHETIGETIADGHHVVPAACGIRKDTSGVALLRICREAGRH